MKHLFTYLILCTLATWSAGVFGQSIQPGSGHYNIRSYGAIGDGKQLEQVAINKAIAACAKNGGGTVYIPPGKYLSGSIHLKSNINLHLEVGATIVAAPSTMGAYDPSEPFPDTAYQDRGHTHFHNSLIWGEGLSNVSITGRGMIDGSAMPREDTDKERSLLKGPTGVGNKAIALKQCKNVLIRDITVYRGGHFAIIVTGCDRVTLENLTIDTIRDGINIDCGTNTLINNCRVNSPGDDAIAIKSSYALNRPVITENLIITNCQVSAFKVGTLLDGTRVPDEVPWSGGAWGAGRIKFGTESNGGFRNCVVSNCTFWNSNGIALEMVDGGIMDNIVVSNISMTNVHHYPIYVSTGQRNRGPKATTTKMGVIRNIMISNINVIGADSLSGIQITGMPRHPVENITLRNISIQYKGGGTLAQAARIFPELGKGYPEPSLLGVNPSYGLFARHVKGLGLYDLSFSTLTTDERPAIIAEDVQRLDIGRFRFPENKTGLNYLFSDVADFNIENSPLLKRAVENKKIK
ncbi:MAG TPA: glycoside hydrolase family 28 protein [Pedobacter sp.]|jgi:polygalacturonase